jgi:hypothetical protein
MAEAVPVDHPAAGDLGGARIFEQCLSAAIVSANPAAPIDLVKEPVHDDQQHDDCQQPGSGLQIERRHVVAQRTNDPHRDHPRDQTGDKRNARAERNWPAMGASSACHARSDRCQNQNAFQPLAKDENPNVQKGHGRAGVGARRIGRAVCRNSLPHKHRHHAKCSYNDADA